MKQSDVDRLLSIYDALLNLSESVTNTNDKQHLINRLQAFEKEYPQIVTYYYDRKSR